MIDHSMRTLGLVIGSLGLLFVALANTDAASSLGPCFGMCGCYAPNPIKYTSPNHVLTTCPTWVQRLPVLRLINVSPPLFAILLLGSVILAVQGWFLERMAGHALVGKADPGWADWSERRMLFMANFAQVLQLLPLMLVIGTSFFAVLTFSGT